MPLQRTVVEILNSSLEKIAEVRNLYPINKAGDVLRYSKELSDFGRCTFRVSAYDPLLDVHGDILKPHQYHVRVRRDTTIVWQGAIIENPVRNRSYIEVTAVEYLWYFNKNLIRRTSTDANGTTNIFRAFTSGSMAAAVTAVVNEAIQDYQGNHILSTLTLGTIDNPNYPPNMVDVNGNTLTGGWYFSDSLQLQFDFHNTLYVLKSFGMYTYADFNITSDLQFNFRSFLGADKRDSVSFDYGAASNIIDYNLPRFGQRMFNKVTAIATDENGVILHYEQSDQASVAANGLIEGIAAYSDVKTKSLLNARAQAELSLISNPDENSMSVVLDESGYPLGLYDIGDLVTVRISNKSVQYEQPRRIVGITVTLHNTGREVITVQTNRPLQSQLGA